MYTRMDGYNVYGNEEQGTYRFDLRNGFREGEFEVHGGEAREKAFDA